MKKQNSDSRSPRPLDSGGGGLEPDKGVTMPAEGAGDAAAAGAGTRLLDDGQDDGQDEGKDPPVQDSLEEEGPLLES